MVNLLLTVLVAAAGSYLFYKLKIPDSALALGNVMLAATSLSLVSCYVNQLHWLDGNDVVRDYLAQLGLPREESIYGTVVLGYTNAAHRSAAPRREGRIRILP